MPLTRRQFGRALLTLPLLPTLSGLPAGYSEAASGRAHQISTVTPPFRLLSSASQTADGNYALQLLDGSGHYHSHPLPSRAHQVISHPTRPWVAVFARRPGSYIDLVDQQQGQLQQRLEAGPGYHFYGHGVFSPDGRLLITSENHIASGEGSLSVRDLEANGRLIRRFSSGGVGPHQLALMPDGDTLVVANGGIRTHPDEGRKKLNLDSMSPSLAYISLADGRLLEQHRLEPHWYQLSIRHLAVNDAGLVAIAMQYQGAGFDEVPLIASHRRGETLQPLWAPQPVNRAMKHYCGSVNFDHSGRYLMVSSPRGNLVTLWDMQQQQFLQALKCRDGCGVASAGKAQFMVSNGFGELFQYRVGDAELTPLPVPKALQVAWDNHLMII